MGFIPSVAIFAISRNFYLFGFGSLVRELYQPTLVRGKGRGTEQTYRAKNRKLALGSLPKANTITSRGGDLKKALVFRKGSGCW